MARPKKEGLEYFPLDVDMDQDDKIIVVVAKHGMLGFGIVIKLMMEIYKNGYYYEWTEKEQLVFSSRINVDINTVLDVVNDCIKWGFFHSNMFKDHSILTSKGIQERFLLATTRRIGSKINYLFLLAETNNNEYINTNSEVVNDIINDSSSEVYVNNTSTESTQSKVKESKVKESNKDSCPKQVYDEESIHYKLALRLYQKILDNNPDYKKPNLQNWSNDIRKLVELDDKTPENVEKVIDWVQQHDFWYKVVLSAAKLRKQYDRLVVDIRDEHKKKNKRTKGIENEDLREKLRKEAEHGQAPSTRIN
jgi:hypothetical protein